MPTMRLPDSWFKSITDPASSGSGGVPNVGDFAGMGEITLQSQGQLLNNLLNHVEDLKGTPYEKAAEALAEKAPHVFGSVENVRLNKLPYYAPEKKMPFTAAGVFHSNPAHDFGVKKGLGVGDITLNPGILSRSFQNPSKVLGHEVTHAAQSLAHTPEEFNRLYAAETAINGYGRNGYEIGADEAGNHLVQALKGWMRF